MVPALACHGELQLLRLDLLSVVLQHFDGIQRLTAVVWLFRKRRRCMICGTDTPSLTHSFAACARDARQALPGWVAVGSVEPAPCRESAPPVPSCGTERESAAASARRASSSAERPAMVYWDPSGPVGAVSGGRQPPRQNPPQTRVFRVFRFSASTS
jgi:hypothetical protein